MTARKHLREVSFFDADHVYEKISASGEMRATFTIDMRNQDNTCDGTNTEEDRSSRDSDDWLDDHTAMRESEEQQQRGAAKPRG
jgi:hypothetical protein